MFPPPRVDMAGADLRELTPHDVARLQGASGYPMVSVLLPTSPNARPVPADIANLERLIDGAERRLTAELPGAGVEGVIAPLRNLAAEAAGSPTGLGMALFSGAGVIEAYRLPLGPVPRVAIDPTFATRDLARAVAENPPYRLLTLASGLARLYVGSDHHLREIVDGGFPLRAPSTDRPADRRGHLHQAVRTHRSPRRWDDFLRQVDQALAADQRTRGLSLVLAATEPLASRYRSRTEHEIIGTIAGNHQRTSPTRLSELARPIIEAHLIRQRHDELDQLARATNQGRAVTGINQVWRCAHDGRIAVLLVDPDYVYPARPGPDGRSLTPSRDPEHPAVLDDAVDEIIEFVVIRGGRVCFTPLSGGHKIAAELRTS